MPTSRRSSSVTVMDVPINSLISMNKDGCPDDVGRCPEANAILFCCTSTPTCGAGQNYALCLCLWPGRSLARELLLSIALVNMHKHFCVLAANCLYILSLRHMCVQSASLHLQGSQQLYRFSVICPMTPFAHIVHIVCYACCLVTAHHLQHQSALQENCND